MDELLTDITRFVLSAERDQTQADYALVGD